MQMQKLKLALDNKETKSERLNVIKRQSQQQSQRDIDSSLHGKMSESSDDKTVKQPIVDGTFSILPYKRIQQGVYILMNDFESSKLALTLSLLSILIIAIDNMFLILETEATLHLDQDLWVRINIWVCTYFLVEFLLRIGAYNAFDETLKEFITRPFNCIDLMALLYSISENIVFLMGYNLDSRVKTLRMLIVLRLVRIFKFSTFSKGVHILIRGLIESLQALSLLLFFTMICVILISSFMYFAEKEFVDESQINNIPQAIWWAIITITTVGYGDYVPKSFLGKIIGAFTLIFGVLLLSLPVAIIGNKFQEIYQQNKKEETKASRDKVKAEFNTCKDQDEKEIYRIIMKLNELEQVNERIEQCLQDNQFLYRSISRDAQNMIDKIELNKGVRTKQTKKDTTEQRVMRIRSEILENRKNK